MLAIVIDPEWPAEWQENAHVRHDGGWEGQSSRESRGLRWATPRESTRGTARGKQDTEEGGGRGTSGLERDGGDWGDNM